MPQSLSLSFAAGKKAWAIRPSCALRPAARLLGCLVLLLLMATSASAQVSLNPTGVFLNNHSRYTSVTISNGSHTPQEVDISFEFAYPTTTETGRPVMVRDDRQKQANHDMAPYLSVYPNKFVLAPGRSQTVRVFVDAGPPLPAELEEGVRWARLVTTAVPQEGGVFSPAKAGESQAQVKVGISQVTAVIYRGGEARAEIDMGTPRIGKVEGDRRGILVPIDHRGDAPFWGTAKIDLYDAEDNKVASFSRRMAAYEDMVLALGVGRLSGDRVPPGRYRAEVSISPRRPDVPPAFQSKVEPFGRKVDLRVPAQ